MAALQPVHTTEREDDRPTSPSTPAGGRERTLLDEGRRLLDRASTGDQRDRGQVAVMAGELMDRARRSAADGELSPHEFARVLRAGALVRTMARLLELPPDPLVHELIAHTVHHDLAAHNAAAQALRGTLAVSRGAVDDALDAAADSMTTLELIDEHSVERALALNDTAALLDQLGLPEVAGELFGRSAAEFGELGMVGYRLMMSAERVRTELLSGMWLERIGRADDGADRFAAAAGLARETIAVWRQTTPAVELDDEFDALTSAAFALAEPGATHEEQLRDAVARIAAPGHLVAGLALVRLLAADGRPAEADAELTRLRIECRRFQLGLPLRLALAKGVPGAGVSDYLAELESEMWAVRESRLRALHGRLEFERLRRGGRPLAVLTTEDPVTRLPDRSALDDLMGRTPDPAELPAAMAMVDVDDLVKINKKGSYADGDAALRAIAVTVRRAVRQEDTVLRYSDDEFVVLMPNRTLDEAAEAMRAVTTAVAALPHDRARGATVSVGVVAVDPDETGESTLIRVDEATGQAKARGGNQIAVAQATPSPR